MLSVTQAQHQQRSSLSIKLDVLCRESDHNENSESLKGLSR